MKLRAETRIKERSRMVERTAAIAADQIARWTAVGIQTEAANVHEDAPRGGSNTNRYGEQRSAAGEPPAPEERDLLRSIIQQTISGMQVTEGEYDVFVNHLELERGDGRGLKPRPLGRIALENYKSGG